MTNAKVDYVEFKEQKKCISCKRMFTKVKFANEHEERLARPGQYCGACVRVMSANSQMDHPIEAIEQFLASIEETPAWNKNSRETPFQLGEKMYKIYQERILEWSKSEKDSIESLAYSYAAHTCKMMDEVKYEITLRFAYQFLMSPNMDIGMLFRKLTLLAAAVMEKKSKELATANGAPDVTDVVSPGDIIV